MLLLLLYSLVRILEEAQLVWGIIMVNNGTQKMCISNAVTGKIFCNPEIIDGINDHTA
jgi:hypothetical protein